MSRLLYGTRPILSGIWTYGGSQEWTDVERAANASYSQVSRAGNADWNEVERMG